MRPPISFRRWALALAAVLVFFVGKPFAREPDACACGGECRERDGVGRRSLEQLPPGGGGALAG